MLPVQKTPPKRHFHDLTILVYGKQKCGKSEFCSQADGALFLATEAGLNSLEVFQVPISTWDELLAVAAEIAEGKHAFKTVILDTVDNAYRMCADWVCRKFKIEHESDLPMSKGYGILNNEFYRVLNKLAMLPYGLVLVSHAQDKEIETRTGKVTRIIPTLPDKARKLVLGMVDVIAYCDTEAVQGQDGKVTHKRVLRTKPSNHYEAGDRTRRLPETLDFDFKQFASALTLPAATPPTEGTSTPGAETPGQTKAAAPPAKAPPTSPAPATNKPAAAAGQK